MKFWGNNEKIWEKSRRTFCQISCLVHSFHWTLRTCYKHQRRDYKNLFMEGVGLLENRWCHHLIYTVQLKYPVFLQFFCSFLISVENKPPNIYLFNYYGILQWGSLLKVGHKALHVGLKILPSRNLYIECKEKNYKSNRKFSTRLFYSVKVKGPALFHYFNPTVLLLLKYLLTYLYFCNTFTFILTNIE